MGEGHVRDIGDIGDIGDTGNIRGIEDMRGKGGTSRHVVRK